jgi:PBP1b-binding outer membrane lipoprotein LpoB
MRLTALPVLCTIVVFSGCASRAPVAERAPATAVNPVAIAKTNRFDMRQDGRSMSAEDFDAWMRARGIRIAKGPQLKQTSSKATADRQKHLTATPPASPSTATSTRRAKPD